MFKSIELVLFENNYMELKSDNKDFVNRKGWEEWCLFIYVSSTE